MLPRRTVVICIGSFFIFMLVFILIRIVGYSSPPRGSPIPLICSASASNDESCVLPHADTSLMDVSSFVAPEARAEICRSVSRHFGTYAAGAYDGAPPKTMPPELRKHYLLNGHILPKDMYFNDKVEVTTHKKVYSKADLNDLMTRIAGGEVLGTYPGVVNNNVYNSLRNFSHTIRDKTCLFVGTIKPHFELASMVHGGASDTITVDFNPLDLNHPRMQSFGIDDWNTHISSIFRDSSETGIGCAVSISSLEHDGLGRYGDPLNPFGDLWSMYRMRCLLDPGSTLFLSLPTGPDALFWNAHRSYGPVRWGLMREHWDVLGWFGMPDELSHVKGSNDRTAWAHQPVVVLRSRDFTVSEYSWFLMLKDVFD